MLSFTCTRASAHTHTYTSPLPDNVVFHVLSTLSPPLLTMVPTSKLGFYQAYSSCNGGPLGRWALKFIRGHSSNNTGQTLVGHSFSPALSAMEVGHASLQNAENLLDSRWAQRLPQHQTAHGNGPEWTWETHPNPLSPQRHLVFTYTFYWVNSAGLIFPPFVPKCQQLGNRKEDLYYFVLSLQIFKCFT